MNELKLKNILTEVLYGARLCESANQEAIVDFFYTHLLLEKLLVGEPVSVPEIRKILRNKILNFEFVKLDGEIRPARGTTMMKYIPTADHPKGIRPSSPKVATFFDMDKKAWRSVSQRSKEIVLKYAYSEKDKKKRPVFIVRDKPDPDKEPDAKDTADITDVPSFSEPTTTQVPDPFVSTTADQVTKDDIEDVEPIEIEEPEIELETEPKDEVTKDDIEDVKPVSMPKVKPVSTPQIEVKPVQGERPKYGWRIKKQHKPESKPTVKPIVRPSITAKPVPEPPKPKDTEVLLPKEVKHHPFVQPPEQLPTKEPPLEIEPDEDQI